MKNRLKVLFTFLAALSVPIITNQPVFAQSTQVKTKPTTYTEKQIFNFDIAGVKLGMSAAQATAALQSRGYSVEAKYINRNFEVKVLEKLNSRNENYKNSETISKTMNNAIRTVEGISPGGEEIEVKFMASPINPDGLMVSEINLKFNDSFDADAIRKSVFEKYGIPNYYSESWKDYYWTSIVRNYSPKFDDQPYLVYSGKTLRINYSEKYEEILNKMVEDEATRRQPLKTKPNF